MELYVDLASMCVVFWIVATFIPLVALPLFIGAGDIFSVNLSLCLPKFSLLFDYILCIWKFMWPIS